MCLATLVRLEESSIMPKSMQVKISSLKQGLETLNDVEMIRLRSKDYNLLIMVDFQSTLGALEDAKIEIVQSQNQRVLEHVNGFYLLKDNLFSLLMDEG